MSKPKGKARAKASKKKKNKQKNDFFIRKKYLLGEIRKYDDSVLAVECEVVPEGQDVKDIFKKMKQVLNVTENGVGLAASQIGVTKKMITVKSDSDSRDIICMINPEIESMGKEKKFGREMCLSYPQTVGMVERYTSVEVSYHDENWEKRTVEYEEGNILGIIVQHELSHLSEGHCEIYDWWKDPEKMQKELEERFKPSEEETSGNEVEESEDMKREREEGEAQMPKLSEEQLKEAKVALAEPEGSYTSLEDFEKETE